MFSAIAWWSGVTATALHLLVMVLLAVYGLHSLWLLGRFLRYRRQQTVPPPCLSDEPLVLVQLPVFNERDVVERVIAAVGALDWPRERLRIQLLDDSTDDSVDLGAAAIARLRDLGVDAVQVRRDQRDGFKAGALANGLRLDDTHAHGPAEFIALFDADFVPAADFLRRALPSLLNDPSAAFVQARWEHLNPRHSTLTQAQAICIDGHFAIEQGARAWSGLALNFNGTCGVWRRSAIDAAGGWQHDTLTEDLDLSYRAQLAGWHGTYRLDVAVPGELPRDLPSWRVQQFRWAKGSLQTARKLLPAVWRSSWSLVRKCATTLHLTHYLVHPLILAGMLLAPLSMQVLPHAPSWVAWTAVALLLASLLPPFLLYSISQIVLRRPWTMLFALPALTALGSGLAVINSRGAWEVVRGINGSFVRTPKHGEGAGSYRPPEASGIPELLVAMWGSLAVFAAWHGHHLIGPLVLLCVAGFAHHGWSLFRQRLLTACLAACLVNKRTTASGTILIPLGLLLLTPLAALVSLNGSWRTDPTWFAAGACLMGAMYLAALFIVRTRSISPPMLTWIILIGVINIIIGTGISHSDDVNRYLTEGAQIAAGQNPYAIPPSLAGDVVAPDISAGVNHPEMTAIYPPFALLAHAAISAWSATPLAMTVASTVTTLIALFLCLALMLRLQVAPGLILAAAWNPVLPLFSSGEAHHDIAMVALVLLALLALTYGRSLAALLTVTVALLVKPFAVVLLPVVLHARGWRSWWIVPIIIALAYLPFADAGFGLVSSLLTFGGAMHFHGAFEPFIRMLSGLVLSGVALEATIRVVLLLCLFTGWWWVWRQRTNATIPVITVRLFTVLLLCAPTLHPWYFIAVVLLLPFVHGWALPLWTACAGIYWLHGQQILTTGQWIETPWVTMLAHVPAMVLITWEVFFSAAPAPKTSDLEAKQVAHA